ncbi:MAG TPA: PAS domain S-box protein, partial [Chloroflexota bacterium]
MTDLSMLQRVVRVLEDTTRSTSGAIQQSADLILEAWRDSGVGGVRISAGEEEAVTPAFPNAGSMQHVEFNVSNGQNGTIEVAYAPDAADQAPRAEQETVLKIVAEMLAGRLERRAAEMVLRDREAQLAEAQRVARVGSWLLDLATQHLTWSDEHYRILGLEPGTDAVAYLEGLEFVHPDDRQMVRSLIDTVIRERSAYSVEVRVVQPDGTIRWVESRGAFMPDGRAGRVVGTALDITERVEAEQQRARLAEHIQLLLESTSDGLFGVDLAGRCTFINEAGAALLGYQPEEMVGQPIEPSAVLRHRDGRLLAVEYSVNPILEGEDVVGAVVAFRDVSERVQAEARVRESEQRLRLVTRATHDAVWDWDLITDSLTWNEAVEPLFGYPSGRIAPDITWWRERIHPDDRERILGSISAALERGDTTWSGEYRYRRADGSYADVLDRGYIVREANGRAVRAIGAVQDVSDRKRAEAALAVRARQQAAAAALGLWALTDASLGLLMSTSVNMLVSVLDVELAGFLENEPANDRLVLTVGAGWPEDAVGSAAAQVQPAMLLGRLLEDSAPVSVDDLSTTDRFPIDPLLRDQGVRSGLA